MNLREICGTGTRKELGAKGRSGNSVTTVLIDEICTPKNKINFFN